LVKSYVASAIKDLTDQMNRRIEQNALMLRLQSLATGRSVAELALAGTQDFEIKDLYLIRRGTGELIAHWPESGDSNRQQVMSGVLTAVNEFANEAFAADQSSLRQISFGNEEVYLRGSSLYLLAARCSGTAPKSIEQTLDDAFLGAVETQHQIDTETAGWQDGPIRKSQALAALGLELSERVEAQKSEMRQPVGSRPLKILAALIFIPLISWLAWSWYGTYTEDRVRSTAQRVISVTAEMQGYPADFMVGRRGQNITISGLAPSQATKAKVMTRLAQVLPGTQINDKLTVVAGSAVAPSPDVTPQIEQLSNQLSSVQNSVQALVARRSSDRAEQRLAQASADLNRAAADDSRWGKALTASAATLQDIIAGIKAERLSLDTAPDRSLDERTAAYRTLASRVAEQTTTVTQLVTGTPAPKRAVVSTDATSLDAATEILASEAEHIGSVASTIALAKSLRPTATAAPAPAAPQVSPRDRLRNFAATKAIFFGAGTDYRNAQSVAQTLQDLAPLIKEAGVLVRVVGYTDEIGNTRRNQPLARERAEKVRQDLMTFGAPPSLLASIGRTDLMDLSNQTGASSPNRRVEFEIGFDGEPLP
jgi:outer membrane protein OmpA-like peptidoglycan-associated protein